MPSFSLVLFDDRTALDWEPFALTRPAGELLYGTLTLRARMEAVLGAACALHLTAPHLHGFTEAGAPPAADYESAPRDGDRVFLLSRLVPAWDGAGGWTERPLREGLISCGGVAVGWFAPAGTEPPPPEFFRDPAAHPLSASAAASEMEGRVLDHVWSLVSGNAEQIEVDVRARCGSPSPPSLPAGVHHWGQHPLIVHESARLEPGSVFDTSGGPIWLDREVVVRAFTRMSGPAYVGPGSHILGGEIESVSVGPVCKLRGELSGSIVAGYSNKQHDGFIGHAYLGRWVNLGAGTTNSDLKNNYGTIRLWTPRGDTDTGEIKLGCLIGDHVKTGIGLLVNTGTVIGAGSNLWGAALPPKYVPPFSWGSGADLTEYRLDRFLEVTERAMGRREVALTPAAREQLSRAYERSRARREPAAAPGG